VESGPRPRRQHRQPAGLQQEHFTVACRLLHRVVQESLPHQAGQPRLVAPVEGEEGKEREDGKKKWKKKWKQGNEKDSKRRGRNLPRPPTPSTESR
jgi:hypothetical protein